MNKFFGIGRLTKDPEVRYATNSTCVARYTLAVDRKYKKEGEATADFLNCVAFGKQGEFVEKYLHKGMKIAVMGRIQTGSYKNKDGQTVYTTDILVEEYEFCESKAREEKPASDGFMQIPDDVSDDFLPFN